MHKILIFEDSKFFLKYFSQLFSKDEFQIQTFDDPSNFLDKIKEFNPDCIVTDLEMPVHSGIDICLAVKGDEVCKHIPIMILTSHEENDQLIKNAIEKGADDFVSKDASELVIKVKVRNLIRISELKNELVGNEQFKAINLVIGRVNHEFNNIITIIEGNLSLLKSKLNSQMDEKAIAKFDKITHAVGRMKVVMEQLNEVTEINTEEYGEKSDYLKIS